MPRFWFERQLPAEFVHLLEGAEIAGYAAETPDDPLARLPGSQAIIASAKIRYDGALMDRAPGLKVISRTGIGYDNISIPDATARKIAVCYAPDAPTIATAEHTIALLFAVAREIQVVNQELRDGVRKDFFNASRGVELNGLRLGLVGLGRIGGHVAKIAKGIGMRVMAFDPLLDDAAAAAKGVERAARLEDLLATADVVSLHLPMSEATRALMNAERFALMKTGAIFINAARGGLVDEDALVAALKSGKLHGAGIDVFVVEPPPATHPLLALPNVVATPHTAGVTGASRVRVWTDAIRQAHMVLRGIRPPHLLNPEILGK